MTRSSCCVGVYTTFVMLMNTSSVMLTVLVLNLHHRNECRPIPRWLRSFALVGLGRLMCMYSTEHATIFPQDRRKSSVYGPNDFIYSAYNTQKVIDQLNQRRRRDSMAATAAKDCSRLPFSATRRLAEQIYTSRGNPVPASERHHMAGTSHRMSSLRSTSMMAGRKNECRAGGKCYLTVSNNSDLHSTLDLKEEEEEEDELLDNGLLINIELQEWKQLARIMDRLFFWLTLTALISVSVVLSCLLFWQQ